MMTRTDGRRFPVLIAAMAALAVAMAAAMAALGLLLSPVQAQESETLVSNTGKSTNANISFGTVYSAQGFATGSKAGGYVLSSIELDVERVPASSGGVTVELWSSMRMTDIEGNDPEAPEPDARLATLTHSTGTWDTGLNTLNAPADTQLGPNTTYFVFVSDIELSDSLRVYATESSSADAGGASGWRIGERFTTDKEGLSTGNFTGSSTRSRLKFKVNGYELINQPSEIRAYWTDSETNKGNLQVGCAGTEPFRAFWERPKRADQWEAEVEPEYGASNLSLSSIDYIGDGFHDLTGSVHIRDGEFSVVSIRVRGRFGDDGWGAWSRPTELFCNVGGL